MQKFTRPLTREIELGGERLALTLSADGVVVRPVGSRKPPHEVSWSKLLCAATGTDDVAAAVEAVKKGSTAKAAAAPAATPAAPAATPATGGLTDLLARLERWLRQHRHDIVAGLRPGATPEELDAFQARLGVPVPASLRTLLAWHNGQSEDAVGGFEQDWRLMGTTEIEEARRESLANPPAGGAPWQPAWLPVFDDNNGDYLCLDTSAPGAPVRAFWAEQPDHPVVAPSLEAWFEDFVSAVERGLYHEEAERGTFMRNRTVPT